MRIGIDARFLTHPQLGGFKTYTMNLVTSLAEIDLENEYILYLDRAPWGEIPLPASPNFSYRIIKGQAPVVGMLWREQVRLSQQASRDHLDLLHSPCLTAPLYLACPSVVTIHDTIWRFPDKYAKRKRVSAQRRLMEWYYRYIPQLAVNRASVIITVSQAAKESITRQLQMPAERIKVTYEAASDIFQVITDQERLASIRQKYEISTSFILAIGSADPRKNISTLIRAYGLLPAELQKQYELVIVWNHNSLISEMAEQIKILELRSRIRFIRQVTNEDLSILYNAASLFVFPSLYEGFGLPLVEAMSCGTPVIASSNSSIPEIVGDAALLVKAEDTQSMARLMEEVLRDRVLRHQLSEKGLQRAKYFSWKECGYETVSAYRLAATSHHDRVPSNRRTVHKNVV